MINSRAKVQALRCALDSRLTSADVPSCGLDWAYTGLWNEICTFEWCFNVRSHHVQCRMQEYSK